MLPKKILLHNAAGFFFPHLCIVCRSPLGASRWLCGTCENKLNANNAARDACLRCGENKNLRPCSCRTNDYPFESMLSLFDFDAIVRPVVHEIKYCGNKRLGYYMGQHSRSLIPASFFDNVQAVVPVPLHPLRRLKRGYNQTDYFARGILSRDGGCEYLPEVLKRKRWTKTQTKLSKEQRRKNMDGAFCVPMKHRSLLLDKNIVVVDDVVTTGATVSACTQALLDAGCASVKVLSLARD
jgi:competence protein ComFC